MANPLLPFEPRGDAAPRPAQRPGDSQRPWQIAPLVHPAHRPFVDPEQHGEIDDPQAFAAAIREATRAVERARIVLRARTQRLQRLIAHHATDC